MKRLLSLAAAAAVAWSMAGSLLTPENTGWPRTFPVYAEDAEIVDSGTCGADGDNVTWTLDSEGTLRISGEGEMKNFDSYPQSKSPFNSQKSIQVIIENGVTSIGEYAFYCFDNLTSITIPDSVTSIGKYAFYNCSKLTSITIPDSVTSIGSEVFYNTPWLKSKQKENPLVIINDILIDGSACSGDVTIPVSVTNIGDKAFYKCSGLTNITIPDSVTSISDYAFYYCDNLTSITIPNSVTSIGNDAFWGCTGLTSITIPNSVTSIGYAAFFDCSSLTCITIPDSVTSFGGRAFEDTPWLKANQEESPLVIINGILIDGSTCSGDVSIPDSVTSIGNAAFYNCSSLTSITIPDSVTNIGDGAFEQCTSLTGITIPDSVTNIGDFAFQFCRVLSSIMIPNSVTSIGYAAFECCYALTSITIPENVTCIGDSAFHTCDSLTNITIGDSVTCIGDYAFYGCSKLTSITIPDSVTSIGDYTFWNCSGLTSITIGDSVTSFGKYAFFNCQKLTEITIPDSVTSIGYGAFQACIKLKSIAIPNGVTSIDKYVCDHCSDLTEITIPDSVTYIGDSAFKDCSRLTEVNYSGTEEQWSGISIDSNNSSLTNATIHYNSTMPVDTTETTTVTTTTETTTTTTASTSSNLVVFEQCGDDVWYHISDDGECVINGTGDMWNFDNDYEKIDEGQRSPFYNNSAIKTVVIQEGVTSIGNGVFQRCDGIESVVLPENIARIGINAFNICTNLKDITFENPDCSIPDDFTVLPESTVIHALYGSTAEIYAIRYGRTFQSTGGTPVFTALSETTEQTTTTSETTATTYKVPEKIRHIGDALYDYDTALQNYYDQVKKANDKDKKAYKKSSEDDPPYIRLMNWDQSQSSKMLTFSFFDNTPKHQKAKEDTYEVLYEYLVKNLEIANKKHIIELEIDNSKPLPQIEADIINKIHDSVWWSCKDPGKGDGTNGYTVEMKVFGGIFDSSVGDVTITKDKEKYTAVFCTRLDLLQKAMNQFLNDLCDEVRNEYKEACFALWDYFKDKSTLGEIATDIEKSELKKLTDDFVDLGYGKILKNLAIGKSAYDAYNDMRNHFSSKGKIKYADLEKLLSENDKKECNLLWKAIKKAKISDDEVSDKLITDAMSQLEKKRDNLERALYDYIYDTDTYKPEKKKYGKKVSCLCPVDVEIYNADTGTLVGSVIDGLVYTDGSIEIECYGDEKIAYLPNDQKYDIKLTGTDEGVMQILYTNIVDGEETEYIAFYDVPLSDGATYTQSIDTSEMETDPMLFPALSDMNGDEINASAYYTADDEDRLVTVNVETVEGGTGCGAGEYTKGDLVMLSASPDDGYRFVGWYEDDMLVSLDGLYCFPAMENLTVTPEFEKVKTENTDYNFTLGDTYADDILIVLMDTDKDTATAYISIYKENQGAVESHLAYYNGTTDVQTLQSEDGTHYLIEDIAIQELKSLTLYDSDAHEITSLQMNAGDANGDGSLSLADTVLVQRYCAEDTSLTKEQIDTLLKVRLDLNRDGMTTLLDLRQMLRMLSGIN